MPTIPWNRNINTTRFTQQGPPSGVSKGFTGAMAFTSAMQAFSGFYAERQRAKAIKDIARINERTAEYNALDARNRGQELVARERQRGKKAVGAQRTVLAASGVRVDVGSAQDIQQETLDISELDALTIRSNAIREGLGYKTEAVQATTQGALTAGAARQKNLDTLLTGGLKTARFFERSRRGF